MVSFDSYHGSCFDHPALENPSLASLTQNRQSLVPFGWGVGRIGSVKLRDQCHSDKNENCTFICESYPDRE